MLLLKNAFKNLNTWPNQVNENNTLKLVAFKNKRDRVIWADIILYYMFDLELDILLVHTCDFIILLFFKIYIYNRYSWWTFLAAHPCFVLRKSTTHRLLKLII